MLAAATIAQSAGVEVVEYRVEQNLAKLGEVGATRTGRLIASSCGRNSGVECQLPKLDVAGSNPVARSAL